MQLKNEIELLIQDNVSGSSLVLENFQLLLIEFSNKNEVVNKEDLISNLNLFFENFNQFAIVFHFINNIFHQIENSHPEESEIESNFLIQWISEYRRTWQNVNQQIGDHFIEFIRTKKIQSVLLHSNSSTVCEAFKDITLEHQNNIKIYQTMSAPANEGKLQAEYLANIGLKVNFISDITAGIFMNDIDLLVLGADVLFKDFFINKAGSGMFATLFGNASKPVVVLMDSRKYISFQNHPIALNLRKEMPKSPDEIWTEPPPGVTPINYYFEEILNNRIDYFITEKGVLLYSQIADLTDKKVNPSRFFSTSKF